MKPIAIFRHLQNEGPGYLADFLDARQIAYSLIRIDQGDPIPESVNRFGGLVFMGGPMSVNDNLPWIDKELNLIRKAADAQLPVLGHCLGGQLISKALGGDVRPNAVKEIGWHAVNPVNNQSASQWLNTFPSSIDVFHWHGETFSIPDGAVNILSSRYCEHQAFAIDNILAMQCHVEMTEELVKQWVIENAEELAHPDTGVQPAAEITRNLQQRIQRLKQAADTVYSEWTSRLSNS